MKTEMRATKTGMNWRLASRLSVITFAILVVIVVTVIQQRNSTGVLNASSLQGSDLEGTPAPNFSLTDQSGKQISLQQFKGKPVVLTFLYTHCPDVCPLTAERLHSTMLELGKDAHNVSVLAISTDPKRDDGAAALHFSQQ
ncbi:MAG TPA: SCO family protein, partial [Ktedonobacteraceae bacterium]|nr:SCO family protein [Ktedonobacteraceae bacterium]